MGGVVLMRTMKRAAPVRLGARSGAARRCHRAGQLISCLCATNGRPTTPQMAKSGPNPLAFSTPLPSCAGPAMVCSPKAFRERNVAKRPRRAARSGDILTMSSNLDFPKRQKQEDRQWPNTIFQNRRLTGPTASPYTRVLARAVWRSFWRVSQSFASCFMRCSAAQAGRAQLSQPQRQTLNTQHPFRRTNTKTHHSRGEAGSTERAFGFVAFGPTFHEPHPC